MKPEDFVIPIDKSVKEFLHHLASHPRTILSARYGDGKSYFLSQVIKSQETIQKFVFLTIYPVNYQVVENKDIFESVKRDILFQLYVKGMIKPEYKLTNQQALLFCLQNEGISLAEVLLPFICDSGLAESVSGVPLPEKAGKVIGAGIEVFKQLSQAYKEFRKYRSGEDNKVDKFLAGMDRLPIYENDVVTQIIRDNLKSWKNDNPDKKIVLLFEDMDRIDPAHIFRILNVLSAQMDNCYGYALKPDYSVPQNKFGFDNIVVVLDYGNLQSIFHHFYGQKTNFDGYIEKFSGKGIFEYSLENNLIDYVYDYIHSKTNIDKEFIQEIIPSREISGKNVRKIVECIDMADEQVLLPGHNNLKGCSTTLLTLLVIGSRLVGCDVIKDICFAYFKTNVIGFLRYAGFIIRLFEKADFIKLDDGDLLTTYYIHSFDSDGFAIATKGTSRYMRGDYKKSIHKAFIDRLFSLIGR